MEIPQRAIVNIGISQSNAKKLVFLTAEYFSLEAL